MCTWSCINVVHKFSTLYSSNVLKINKKNKNCIHLMFNRGIFFLIQNYLYKFSLCIISMQKIITIF